MAGNQDNQYDIYSLGLDKSLIRNVSNSTILPNSVAQSPSSENFYGDKFMGGLFDPLDGTYDPQSLRAGELPSLIGHAKKKFTDTTDGFLMGIDTDKIYKWIIGNTTNSIDWSVTTIGVLTIVGAINATSGTIGGFDIGSDYIRDSGNSFGLASTVTGGDDVRFWSGSTFANRATAPFNLTEAGILTIGTSGGLRMKLSGTDNQLHFYNASNVEIATFGASGTPTDVININSPAAAVVHPITIIQNAADTQGSISITNEDTGAGARGIEILQKGDKTSLYVENTSSSSSIVVEAKTAGTGDCGYFSITNNTSTAYGLATNHSGLGIALRVIQQSTANTSGAVHISQGTTAGGNGITVDITSTGAGVIGYGLEINHDGRGRGEYIHCDNSNNANQGLLIEHVGTGTVAQFEMQGSSSTNPVLSLAQSSVTSTNFRLHIDMDGTRIWRSNGTNPNGNLSGTTGDICLNGDNNKPAYCTGTTNWTNLV